MSKAAIIVWYVIGAVVLAAAVFNFFFDLNWYNHTFSQLSDYCPPDYPGGQAACLNDYLGPPGMG
jgi:hypothetical protein